MWTWILTNPWALWLGATILLAVLEMLTLDFFCLMLSGASFVALLASIAVPSIPLQVVVFACAALALLGLLRPTLVNRLHKNTPITKTNADRLIGMQALSLEPITHNSGLARLDGDTWTARVSDPQLTAERDHYVIVDSIHGATLYVSPSQSKTQTL